MKINTPEYRAASEDLARWRDPEIGRHGELIASINGNPQVRFVDNNPTYLGDRVEWSEEYLPPTARQTERNLSSGFGLSGSTIYVDGPKAGEFSQAWRD